MIELKLLQLLEVDNPINFIGLSNWPYNFKF